MIFCTPMMMIPVAPYLDHVDEERDTDWRRARFSYFEPMA